MCQNFLIFTSLIWVNVSFASDQEVIKDFSFGTINKKIKTAQVSDVDYNPSKTAAIVNLDGGSAVYIDFKHKRTFKIVDHWPAAAAEWLDDDVAEVDGPCGTACGQRRLFIAPDIIVSCDEHSVDLDDPDVYRSNHPVFVDTKRKVYGCYDSEGRIQIYSFPISPTIFPPEGYE